MTRPTPAQLRALRACIDGGASTMGTGLQEALTMLAVLDHYGELLTSTNEAHVMLSLLVQSEPQSPLLIHALETLGKVIK